MKILNEEKRFDVGIVLGKMLNEDGLLSKDCINRIEKAVKLFEQKYFFKIIVTGGHHMNDPENKTEADMMKKFLLRWGVPNDAIIVEKRALDTIQNAIHTREICEMRDFKKIAVITSEYHLPRALFCFKQLYNGGYHIEGFASPTPMINREMIKHEEEKIHHDKLIIRAILSTRGANEAINKEGI